MEQYRIKKTTTIKGNGESTERFSIQYKFLFLWLEYTYEEQFSIHTDYNADIVDLALITKREYYFDSLDSAKWYLDKIKELYKEDYKGNKIVEVFTGSHKKTVYINTSKYGFFDKWIGYEFGYSLDELKGKIDRRIKYKKIEYISF